MSPAPAKVQPGVLSQTKRNARSKGNTRLILLDTQEVEMAENTFDSVFL